MARLYSNENFHREVVEKLRKLGYDVLTSLKAGRAKQRIPDEEVLEFATREQTGGLTFNRLHFMRLHRDTAGKHSGVIVCKMDRDTEALAGRIDTVIRNSGELAGRLLRVNRPN